MDVELDNDLIFKAKLSEISSALQKNNNYKPDIGLMSGLSGIALFHFYYSKFIYDEVSYDIGMEMLYNCINKINNGLNHSTYSTGICGYGWVLDHLASENIIDSDNDNILSKLDEYLFSEMKICSSHKNYDFLNGALGYGFYFLKRLNCTQSKINRDRYKTYLIYLLDSLESFAQKTNNNSYRWLSYKNMETGEKAYNLSLSHGMSSIINILSRLLIIEEFKSRVEPMLLGTINYVLSCKNQENSLSLFPNYANSNTNKQNNNSRLAWCYGDLGIAISLLKAAKAINHNELELEALSILEYSTERKSLKENMVFDSGICHGAFGIANVFNQVYKDSQKKVFRESSQFWIKKGLEMAYHTDGFAGYKKLNGKMTDWKNETSLLEGISGIGLVIMDFCAEDKNLKWNECLLLS